MQVPLEIVAQILAYLRGGPTLLACSLVDRSWLPFTRELIYNRVTLITSDDGCAKIEFFEQSPHLTPYVRYLSIFCQRNPDISSAICRLLTVFPNIDNLSLSATQRVRWTTLPSEFTDSFQQLVASGSLRRLQLTWLRFEETPDALGDLLRSCSATLESLVLRALNNSVDITTIEPESALEINFPKLRELALTSVITSSPIGASILVTPNLESLSWESNVAFLPYLTNILPRSSMSNVATFALSLSLDPSHDNPYAVPPIPSGFFPDAWCLPGVRTLSITMLYPAFANDNPLDAALTCVTRCLSQIPNPDVIETINIKLNRESFIESTLWQHLDAVLVDIHKHGSLKAISINPSPPDSWLPLFGSSGLLEASDDADRRLRD